jgi:hypothetical protein
MTHHAAPEGEKHVTPPRVASVLVAGSIVLAGVLLYMLPNGQGQWTATLDTTQLTEGTHTIEALAYDEAGNVGTDTVTIVVDNEASKPESVTAKPAIVIAWKKPIGTVQMKVKESMVSYPTTVAAVTGQQTPYTGTGSSYTDKSPSRYYAVFAKDAAGRWSPPAQVFGLP